MSALIFLGIIAAYVLLGYVVKVALLVADAKLIDNEGFGSSSDMMITLWPFAMVSFVLAFFENYDFESKLAGKPGPKRFSAEAVANRIVEGKSRVVLVEGKGENDG